MDKTHTLIHLPWADDALVRGESLYALINKLAWFSDRGPIELIRDLRATEAMPYPRSPTTLSFEWGAEIWGELGQLPQMPSIHGVRFEEYVKSGKLAAYRRFPCRRAYGELRYCPECISFGMHFDVTQLILVERCPYHDMLIISCCRECGAKFPFSADSSTQKAFSCHSCGASVLRAGLTDIRASQGERRRASKANSLLTNDLLAIPALFAYVPTRYLLSGQTLTGFRHAVTRILANRRRGEGQALTARAPFFVVELEQNKHGVPTLKRLSTTSLNRERTADPDEGNEWAERRLAQQRVGAWALQHLSKHKVCICAARSLFISLETRVAEFTKGSESHVCPFGKGFAVWEADAVRRSGERLSRSLWEAWGLSDRKMRFFALYTLEKACLASAIWPFIEKDRFILGHWEREGFQIEDFGTRFFPDYESRQALLWLDINQMGIDSCCDIFHRESESRLQWLDAINVKGGVNENGTAVRKESIGQILTLIRDYSCVSRLGAREQKWMHSEINRRVRLTMRSGVLHG